MKKLAYVLVAILVVYLGWEFFRPRPGEMRSVTGTASVIDVVGGAPVNVAPAEGPVSVTYSADGFSPKNVTVKKGTAVMWTNVSAGGLEVASGSHPAHADYDGTSRAAHCAEGAPASFDQCAAGAPGSQWSFTFNKAGTWNYHNEANPAFTGTVTVTE